MGCGSLGGMKHEGAEALAADLVMANELHLASPDGQRDLADRMASLPDATVTVSGQWVDLRGETD